MPHVEDEKISALKTKLHNMRRNIVIILIINIPFIFGIYKINEIYDLGKIFVPLMMSPLFTLAYLKIRVYFIPCPQCEKVFLSTTIIGSLYDNQCNSCGLDLNKIPLEKNV